MTTHEFEITNEQIQTNRSPAHPASMTARLAVRPPFEVPEAAALSSIALGRDSWGKSIAHTGTVENDASYFEVSAANGYEDADRTSLQELGGRIVRFADDPSQADAMMNENPFASELDVSEPPELLSFGDFR